TLEASLSGPVALVALAGEGLALALAFRYTRVTACKVLGLVLMLVAAAAALFVARMGGDVQILAYVVPAPWFAAVGVALFFVLAARVYDRIGENAPSDTTRRSPALFRGTLLDAHPETLTLLHAVAAALVLLAATVALESAAMTLPYLLGVEAALMAGAGFLLRSRPVEAASALLLAAAHVSFHLFRSLPVEEFRAQPDFVTLTAMLAAYTYLGAFFWERYLRRFGDKDWSHHVTASLPYLAATFLFTTLGEEALPAAYAPPAQAALAILLLLAARVTGSQAIRASSLLALGVGVLRFYQALYAAPETGALLFPFPFLLLLAVVVVLERVIAAFDWAVPTAPSLDQGLRTVLIAAAALIGVSGLHGWTERHLLILGLLALAVAAILLGFFCDESRYRWAALFLFAVTVLRAFTMTRALTPLQQVLVFGAAGLVLLAVSGVYSWVRGRARPEARPANPEVVRHDGPA
ncbi:MAG TPA: hypothetical protein PKI11_17030, partial [Candidatus Hydrogenedentes bacterium]|nr:hypothetical protein [Candidatus Hydrogenedentota bacterium]